MSDLEYRTCAICGKQAPVSPSDYTLIGSKFGWRLHRKSGLNGTLVLEWRCGNCHNSLKKQQDEQGDIQASVQPSFHSLPPPSSGRTSVPSMPISTKKKGDS